MCKRKSGSARPFPPEACRAPATKRFSCEGEQRNAPLLRCARACRLGDLTRQARISPSRSSVRPRTPVVASLCCAFEQHQQRWDASSCRWSTSTLILTREQEQKSAQTKPNQIKARSRPGQVSLSVPSLLGRARGRNTKHAREREGVGERERAKLAVKRTRWWLESLFASTERARAKSSS